MIRSFRFFLPLLVSILAAFSSPAATIDPIDAAQFQKDLEQIAQSPSRIIGSPGYDSAGVYLQQQISKLPNVELRTQQFQVMVPVTRSATLETADGHAEKIYPFWPAQARVCSTPPDGIRGKLVYVGNCEYEQLRPASLRGQIAVIEASAGVNWAQAFYAGARAALILGTPKTTWPDLQDHDLRIPINLPRFYIPPGPLADSLRAAQIPEATLHASVAWQSQTARNFYALVKPAKQSFDGWTASQPPAALRFSEPYESSSLVADLAPGAGQAAQAAAGLALLRGVAAHPWSRPVIFFFSGADSIQDLATRNMFLALGESPAVWHEEIGTLDAQIAQARAQLARAQALAGAPEQLSIRNDRELIDRISKIIETDLAQEQDRLFRLRAEGDSSGEIKRLEDHHVSLNRVKGAFGQDQKELADPAVASEAKAYIARLIGRLNGEGDKKGLLQQYGARREELNHRIELYHWLAGAEGRTNEPRADQTNARLIELLVGLDLSDRGARVGPMFWGYFQRASSMGQVQDYADWMENHEKEFSPQLMLDFDPLRQQRAPSTFLAGPLSIPSELARAFATPGLSMITLNDLRVHRDTPTDTVENVNVAAIFPQVAGVRDLFEKAWSDPKFKGPVELKRLEVSLGGQVVSASADRPVPDLPREGFLTTYCYVANKLIDRKIPQLGITPWAVGVRRTEMRDCDAEGNYLFEGLPRIRSDKQEGAELLQNDMQTLGVMAYRMDANSGAITATTDLGNAASDSKWSVDIKLDVPAMRSVVFDCEEFALTGLYDPRYLQSLGEIVPLDARRNAEPQRYGMMLDREMLSGFVEPGMPMYLLIRYGRIGNRIALLNMREGSGGFGAESRDEMGYTAKELNQIGPLSVAAARDFYRLDDRRLSDYRRAGVSSALVDGLHEDAGKELAASDESVRKDDGAGLIRNSTGAWANEALVYDAAQDMARDVIRAAVFLLILCVPFAFCMERLLVGTANVYKQIGWACAIFVVMNAALVMFHPAFKISSSPLIIILAFAIILMSCMVIFVVYGKFDMELKRIRSGRGTAAGTSFANAGVMMSAVLLGIANMRRRKFRTLLTSITIVIITFAVLCFTSTAHYVGTSTIPTGMASSHPGIMLRQRGFRPMPGILASQLRTILEDPKLQLEKPQVVERWWAVSVAEPKEQFNVNSPGHEVAVQALLGLSPGEGKLSRIAEVIGADRFARLERGEEKIVYLSDATAQSLGVKEGDLIRLGGIDLQVAGVFNTKKFDDGVMTLGGESIAPLRYTSGQLDANGKPIDDNAEESLDLEGGASAESSGAYEHLSSSQFVIIPAAICRQMQHCSLRSVGFRLADEQQVKTVSEELSRRFALAMYAGYDDGVRMVAASNLSSVNGASQVAIPLAIAGLIIFNTMMGSIAERRREIHVYTSLGLAPLHVGALFVAEAMVYGLVGTVFGYVIGQGAGTAMQKLGWLGSATLNYSGTSAMVTIGLILLIVFISALVPARLASKIAAPSIDRTWKVPPPKEDEILAVLPFTINKTAAEGALAYIAEFFSAHREGSIGKFSSGDVEAFSPENDGSRGLRTDIWLTPFDLGVRQHLELLIHPGQFPDIYEVEVHLRRLSGDDGSWYRLNRTFLTELRKQFLQWRSLAPARMLEYVEESKQLFKSVVQV